MKKEFVERKEYNNVISVKLVLPSKCICECPFCYNNDYRNKLGGAQNIKSFLNNYLKSLDNIINKIGDKNPISLDITGGEPTHDVDLLNRVLQELYDYKINDKVDRVTMTTNTENLYAVLQSVSKVVNYVNFSIHDYRLNKRIQIMDLYTPDAFYRLLIRQLLDYGVKTSAIAVIYEEIPDFSLWRDRFITWCQIMGFTALRFRCDVFWKSQNLFDMYMEDTIVERRFKVITHENTPDSHWCRLRQNDGFRVFFLHGVLDISQVTKGIEYIIHDDGKLYCDYYKNTKIEDYEYEIGKIYDLASAITIH